MPLTDPEAAGKVLYVWFDAPIGYISNTAQYAAENKLPENEYRQWWSSPDTEIFHFIGEDNTIFHCMIWIAMLQAQGDYQLPRGVIVNQYLNMQKPGGDETKMSKSRGTAVWVRDYLDNGGNPDSLRYYLTMVAPERARAAFKPDDMVARHNGELANALGNFVNRILSFSQKNFGPTVPALVAEKLNDSDHKFIAARDSCHREATELLERHEFKAALERIMEFCRECNRYVDLAAPWTSKKTDLERTTTTLKICIDAIRFIAVVIEPFMPFCADNIAGFLNLTSAERGWNEALKGLDSGRPLEEPKILFAKIEDWRTVFPALAG